MSTSNKEIERLIGHVFIGYCWTLIVVITGLSAYTCYSVLGNSVPREYTGGLITFTVIAVLVLCLPLLGFTKIIRTKMDEDSN